MPNKSQHPCYRTGCTNLTVSTYCPEHTIDKEILRKQRYGSADKKRKSSSKRGYGYKHQKIREVLLRNNSFCEVHLSNGIPVKATVYHHRDGNSNNISCKNRSAVCEFCHDGIHERNTPVPVGWFDKINIKLGIDVIKTAKGL